MASHCENGAILNLLKYHDITISEPLIWGIGSGLFFTYLPFLKLDNAPVVSYRPVPGAVFKSLCKRMGIKYTIKKYKSPKKAMKELDERLDQGKPTAMVVGAFYLPYFPTPYRFHFNAHNIIAFDKKDDHYMVSDAIMEEPKP